MTIFYTHNNPLAELELKALGKNVKKISSTLFSASCSCPKRLALTRLCGEQIENITRPVWIVAHDIPLTQALKKVGKIKASKKRIVDVFPALMMRRVFENMQDFESRRAHLREAKSAHSLHPRLARVMVNLTGMRRGVLVDPFCGSGGILIEAGLMGLRFEGSDIDKKSIANARTNLKSFKLEQRVHMQDATTISKKISYIATDLPYGRASKKSKELELLYDDFARWLSVHLKKRAVIMSPDFLPFSRIARKHNLKITLEHTLYVHKSLSRVLCVVETKE